MPIDAITGSLATPVVTNTQPASGEEPDMDFAGGALAREMDKMAQKDANEEAARAERQKVLRDYIETYGAPEEKDQDRVQEKTFLQHLQEQDEKRRGLPGTMLTTKAVIVQDPEDEGNIQVHVVKIDGEGKGKITRKMEFNSGDGEDRSKLTSERAKAQKAQAEGVKSDSDADSDKPEE